MKNASLISIVIVALNVLCPSSLANTEVPLKLKILNQYGLKQVTLNSSIRALKEKYSGLEENKRYLEEIEKEIGNLAVSCDLAKSVKIRSPRKFLKEQKNCNREISNIESLLNLLEKT